MGRPTSTKHQGAQITLPSPDEYLLAVPIVAREFHVTEMTIYRWVKSGKIKARYPGGYCCIHKDEVERLKRLRAPGQGALERRGDVQ